MNNNLIKNYIDIQPIKIVEIDWVKMTLKYSGIKECQKRTKADPEELVRAYIITKLVNECGYLPERIEIEHKIRVLKQEKLSVQSIIDRVFKREFNDVDTALDKLHKGMSYGTQNAKNTELNIFKISFSELGEKSTSRVSSRFHNPLFNDFEILVKNFGAKELRQVVTYIDNGVSPKYVEFGDIPVIKTANITINGLIFEDAQFVDEIQYEKCCKAQIQYGDILICNIGKGSLGKTTINKLSEKMFAATETMIIRVDKNVYDPDFLCYFLNSVFGTYQFEREYTGTTNQIHIAPKIVKRFIVPDISLEAQQRIVDEIQAEIDRQNKIKQQIHSLRREIDRIIENIITDKSIIYKCNNPNEI